MTAAHIVQNLVGVLTRSDVVKLVDELQILGVLAHADGIDDQLLAGIPGDDHCLAILTTTTTTTTTTKN